jgi:hypothetical protein
MSRRCGDQKNISQHEDKGKDSFLLVEDRWDFQKWKVHLIAYQKLFYLIVYTGLA